MKKQKNNPWRILAKSLGEKSGKDNHEADKIAFIRLLITAQILITNFFIIYGVIRTHHFPNYEIQRHLSETKEKR
jgi:hypothetical protein